MTRPDWMRAADERILEGLRDDGPEYLALVANRLGMHLDYVERRCEVLVSHGLVEPLTDEVVYRTTDLGEQYLADELESGRLQVASGD